MRKFSITVAILASLLVAQPSLAQPTPGQINVSGQGEIAAVPDVATISLGVNTEARNAAEALKANNKATAAVLALLVDQGIAAKDMQTSNLSLNPVWDRRKSNDSRPKITGYQVNNTVSVRVRDLPKLGEILDQVVSAGANVFHGLQFGTTQTADLRNQARKAAVRDARAKAELYADAAGVKLGRLISLSESSGHSPRPMMRMEAMAADSVPIAAGEIGININVNMVYEIAD